MMSHLSTDVIRHQYGLLHNRYQDMMALIGYSLWETNDRWALTFASPLLGEILLKPPQLLMRQSLLSLGSMNQKDPRTREALISINQQAPFDNLGLTIVSPNGKQHYLRLQGIPLFSEENGDFIGYRGLINDMTKEMHALEASTSAHNQLQLALRAIPEGFALLDSQQALVMCNQTFKDYFPSLIGMVATGMRLPTLWQAALDKGNILAYEDEPPAVPTHNSSNIVRLKDNRLIQFRVSTSSAGDTVIIGEDLTSHKQREQELYEARYKAEHMLASRSKFIANLSHELRTPLNAIIGFSELTANEFFGNVGHPKYKDYAHDILSSAQHLLSLINDILELSKAEAGQLTLYKEDLDVIAALQQTIVLIREQAEKKQVTLTTDFHKKSYRIIADERKIKQIVLNLLSNAVKFTHINGNVTLSTRLRKNDLLISVGDTGIGLSPNEIQQALSPFGQVINNETKDHIGTGLGLPLVKAMTEAHGGHLDIISEKGKGTTVTVTIPVA